MTIPSNDPHLVLVSLKNSTSLPIWIEREVTIKLEMFKVCEIGEQLATLEVVVQLAFKRMGCALVEEPPD